MFYEYAETVLNLPVEGTFTYSITPDQREIIRPGSHVAVMFHGREEEAIVTGIHSNQPEYECLPILKPLCEIPLVTEDQLRLAEWVAGYYFCSFGEAVFRTFIKGKRIPAAQKKAAERVFRPSHELNEKQSEVFRKIAADLETAVSGKNSSVPVHLIRGVTGSGKTEIYIHLLKQCLESGRSAVFLVPEIALTVQLFDRLRETFGEELALLHSGLKGSQRFASYVSLLRKERKLAVGTRSAVFAPVEKPALFIIDEEHDQSYKEHSAPRYDARQIAVKRASENGAVVVYGSATPRIETEFMARNESGNSQSAWKFSLHILPERAGGARLPEVRIIQRGPSDIPVGPELVSEIDKNIKNKEQTILLLNRRGYAPWLQCSSCSTPARCPHCSVSLTYHRSGELICHYCGFKENTYTNCRECGGKMKKAGAGTQKAEEYIANLHPEIRLERMDTDISRSGTHVRDVITDLADGKMDLLVGTQMIARGIDAPNVTLVGALQADFMLSLPDFRSFERTFSLLTQVAGRAGRSSKPGRVIFEALNPEHPVLIKAAAQDYESFYSEEILQRKEFGYPPFSRLFRLLIRSRDQSRSALLAEKTAEILSALPAFREQHTQLLGPVSAPVEKVNDQYRNHIVIKTKKPETVRKEMRSVLPDIKKLLGKEDYLEIDPDPVDLL